jgi:predicted AlkP superfamily pyrophosphatase or phosphodiesterase
VQSTFLTGLPPRDHGVVGNGWYFRELAEVLFWRQSNALVSGEKVWEAGRARDRAFTCAKLFWWYNLYSSADWSVTPRPAYPADGRKIPDIYAEPAELRAELNARLGRFPLFNFWGPTADLVSTRWIADAAIHVMRAKRPTLSLVYLPHLDYDFQRFGPSDPRSKQAVRDVDAEAGRVADAARELGAEVVVLSEYGITPVSRPVHINRALREAGFLRVQKVLDQWELLDAGACRAFAVADHQIAHIYVKRPEDAAAVRDVVAKVPGVGRVLDDAGKREAGLDHPRAGEFVALAAPDSWFTYYYWLDDALAPDFARTVDIHRKPGYDPAELVLAAPKVKVALKLLRKMLGFRYLMDVIGLDASVVRGSHGLLPARDEDGPVWISSSKAGERARVAAADVKSLILRQTN